MASINTIPLEILRNVLSYLNVLDSKGTPLLRHFNPKKGPDHIGITFHKTNPDISLFNAMRVCKTWRDLIFGTIFKEDVTMWSPRQWQQEIDRFRTVERMVLIEITRNVVVLWSNELSRPERKRAIEERRRARTNRNESANNGDTDEAHGADEADNRPGDEADDDEAPDGNGTGPSTTDVGVSG